MKLKYPAFGDVWTGNLFLSFFCIGLLVVNHAFFRLGALSSLWAILILLAVAGLAFAVPQFDFEAKRVERLRLINLLIGVIILTPLFLSLVLGWKREFPFSGDSYFHVGQSFRMAFWWLSPLATPPTKIPSLNDVQGLLSRPFALLASRLATLVVVVALSALLYRWRNWASLAFAALAFTAWGCVEASIFLRYPGGGYFLDLPFLGPAFLFKNLELAGRLSGFCAAVAWLCVLRPWLIGRWPDLRILPLALLLFWQKDVLYYFDSVYLEPWAVIFSLLAIEMLIAHGRQGAAISCLLIGCAAAVKEPFILALPLMWIAGEPWRAIRDGDWREPLQLTGAGIAAGFPFVLYYVARKSVPLDDIGSDRGFQFGFSQEGLSQYANEFLHQMNFAFPVFGAVLLGVVLAATLFVLWSYPKMRIAVTCALLVGIGIALLFLFDTRSLRWAGYFRFFLYSLPFLSVGLLALGYALKPQWIVTTAILLAALQAPSVSIAISRAAGAATDRNFAEHYDAPIVFPMNAVIEDAQRAGVLAANAPIQANMVDTTLRPLPGGNITYGPPGELFCECQGTHRNVMALFVRFTNMSASLKNKPMDANSRIGVWQKTDAQRDLCLARLKQTCGHVFERKEGGELVAALGTER